MQNWITLAESLMPNVAYHGTCVENWTKQQGGALYVAVNYETAAKYAQEWAEEGETPLVLAIDLDHFDETRFEPNWETVQQHLDMGEPMPEDWRYCAEHFGTFVIANFTEADKDFCRPV